MQIRPDDFHFLPEIYDDNFQGNMLSLQQLPRDNQPPAISYKSFRCIATSGLRKLLSVFFACLITGKTLDCLTPIYQTEKLFNNRFGGEDYPSLVKIIVYSFIGSDIFISVGALFLAKSRNKYL